MIRLGGLRYSLLVLYLPCMTDFYEELVADLDAIGVEVEKAKMSRSEAGRAAANARWGNKGGAPKMVEGGWRSAAGIPAGEQKSNARSKAGMQGARTRAQNKANDSGKKLRDQLAAEGVPEKTLAQMEKNPTGKTAQRVMADRRKAGAAGRAAAEARFGDKGKASSSAVKERRAKEVAQLSPAQQAKYKERMAEKQNMPPSKSFPASPMERRHQDALIVAENYKAPKVKRPKKFS